MNHETDIELRFKRIVEAHERLRIAMEERRQDYSALRDLFGEHGERLARLESGQTFMMAEIKDVGSKIDTLTNTMNGRVKILEAWRWKIAGALGVMTGSLALIELWFNLKR